MKIERLNPPSASPDAPSPPLVFDADELAQLAKLTEPPASSGWTLNGATLSLNAAPPSTPEAAGIIEQIAAMIPVVTDWIESRCGVICQPSEFRLILPPMKKTSESAIRQPILPPIAPIGAITLAKCVNKKLPAGNILLKNGYLVLDQNLAGQVVIELVAGFMPGDVPHTVKHAAAMICRHWIENPTDFSERNYREPDALQLLQMHTPGMAWPTRAAEGGSLWQ